MNRSERRDQREADGIFLSSRLVGLDKLESVRRVVLGRHTELFLDQLAALGEDEVGALGAKGVPKGQ